MGLVKEAIAAGGNLSSATGEGLTPLHLAVHNQNVQLTVRLLESGATCKDAQVYMMCVCVILKRGSSLIFVEPSCKGRSSFGVALKETYSLYHLECEIAH
jgi:ankyrin repeat protein